MIHARPLVARQRAIVDLTSLYPVSVGGDLLQLWKSGNN
jgi:hypothetical protein